MTEASNHNCTTMSIPALGTGLLKYPNAVVATATLKAIEKYSDNNPATKLNYVNVVIYYRDEAVLTVSSKLFELNRLVYDMYDTIKRRPTDASVIQFKVLFMHIQCKHFIDKLNVQNDCEDTNLVPVCVLFIIF